MRLGQSFKLTYIEPFVMNEFKFNLGHFKFELTAITWSLLHYIGKSLTEIKNKNITSFSLNITFV